MAIIAPDGAEKFKMGLMFRNINFFRRLEMEWNGDEYIDNRTHIR